MVDRRDGSEVWWRAVQMMMTMSCCCEEYAVVRASASQLNGLHVRVAHMYSVVWSQLRVEAMPMAKASQT